MKRNISVFLLVFTMVLSPLQLKASEYTTEEIGEYNNEVFKAVDKEGNVYDMPMDEGIVIMPTYDADPTTVSYGVVNLRTKPSAAYNTYYTDANTGKTGYINGYASSEAVFLGLSSDKKKVKFKISNMVGWVDAVDVQVLNYKDCKSISHYSVENGYIYHYGTTDVSGTSYIIQNNIGPAPTYLTAGKKYYSYDGHYFYTSFETMVTDYKAGVYKNAVNPNTAYWNYYQYLPSRSITSLNASQFNSYIPNYAKNGKMANIGQVLIDAQNKYGVNAVMMFAQAAFESGWGMSAIANDKNNLFGHGAADNNPYYGANGYASVKDCVTYHAKVVLSEGYFDPKDVSGRYYGSHVGDKSSGIMVKYCSDPYWGEKVASLCWSLERVYGTNDSNMYTLGIKESNKVYNIYSDENKSNVLFNTSNFLNFPIIVLSEGTMYRIQSDSTLKADRSSIVQDKGEYNFNNDYGYIDKEGITIVSIGSNSTPVPNKIGWQKINNQWNFLDKDGNKLFGWQQYNGMWYYLDKNDGHMLVGWQYINGKWYYLNENGSMAIGWKKVNSKWYYMNDKGAMQLGFMNIDGNTYYFNDKGAMVTGWILINVHWYYFEGSGAMVTGWKKLNNKWYYMNDDGLMQSGFVNIDGNTYYFNDKGAMITGWNKIENNWYYFESGGAMAIGWKNLNNKWYFMNNKGIMETGFIKLGEKTYFLDETGAMVIGWKRIDNNWYYFYFSGTMARDTYVGNYYVNSNGIWIQ